jgi:4-carboxymuconolactone decarboxylase
MGPLAQNLARRGTPVRTYPAQARVHLLALALCAAGGNAWAQDRTHDAGRRERGEALIGVLNNGLPQPALEQLRAEFPFLADAIAGYALGEVWSRPVLDHRTRQLLAVSAFAAQGNLAYLRIHAGYALNHGASEDELKEVVYLTTVHAGFPRAIDAAGVLAGLFEERRAGDGR